MEKINWFWAHRRNSSLHHMSLFVRGLWDKGFLPAVNFHFNNQIYVGKPGKGIYIFYDKNQMKEKYKDVQASIDGNEEMAKEFKATSEGIFKDLVMVCKKIKETDLMRTSNQELLQLFLDFKEKITVGPLITVQLWGIEACWDNDYILAREVKKKVSPEEFAKVKGILSQSTGKSVAFSERESFLKTLLEIKKNPEREEELIKEHVDNYEWINSEYVSEKLGFEKWQKLFEKEVKGDVETELEQLYVTYNKAIEEKRQLVEKYDLSRESRQVLAALNEFVADRDWAKGRFCYALAVYDLILREVAERFSLTKDDLLLMDVEEVISLFEGGNSAMVEQRREGFALVSREGELNIISFEELDQFIQEENISGPFSVVKEVDSFKGIVACKGKVRGKVRVIDDSKNMSDFKEDEILVTYMTTMEFTPLFKKAKGLITDEGGLSSHAAIISREFGLPCVVGTQIATRNLKTNDLVELDADKGVVKVLERASVEN